MKTIRAASFRPLGIPLLLASVAVMASGCLAIPAPGYDYGGPGIALPVPAPPVVVAPVPVYRGGYGGHGHWGHRRWGHYY